RLIRCGSSSFRPVGSVPGTAFPSGLAARTGIRSFRREPPNSTGGTFTHELRTLRGLLRGGLFIAEPATLPLFLFFSGALRLQGLYDRPRGAPLKNKKRDFVRSRLAINRPPLRGLSAGPPQIVGALGRPPAHPNSP